ncbi:MAG TPA: hypothetical protein VEG30_01120 [Terriglobales bacterium]|nr:hypothetical protein [Terriglobales bacterium]
MQVAKDSFYVALRDRLAALSPARTLEAGGVTRPAVLIGGNEVSRALLEFPNAFYLSWGSAERADPTRIVALMKMRCRISYSAAGSDSAAERGRTLGALDDELLAICSPQLTATMDYSKTPATPLGTNVFWSSPKLGEIVDADGHLQRSAEVIVYCFSEVAV